MEFLIDVQKLAAGGNETNLIEIAISKISLAQIFVSQIDNKGNLTSEDKDKPNKLTQEAVDTIQRITGDDKYNYLRAKGLAAVGKVALIQKRSSEAEDIFKKAQLEITSEYTDMHPLASKFN